MSQPAVPLLDLKAQYLALRDEIDAAIAGVLDSQRFIMGPEVEALEREVAAYAGTSYAVACASGSDALLLALTAVGVGPGDEVLCPSYTFFATAGAIWRLGARPVFCDIEPGGYNVDPQRMREVAAGCRRLKVLLPVDLFGRVADLGAILALGQEFGVPVIEDAAQAIGARDASGARAGSRAAIGCFSFFPSKNLGAFGDGGIVTTGDALLAERMAILRLHGSKPKYYHRLVGFNSRLDALQAAVVRVKLRHLDAWTKRRQENAAWYDAVFARAGAATSGGPAGTLALWTPRPTPPPASHIYNQYVLRVPGELRDPLREELARRKIGSEIYYPLGLHQQECFAELGHREGDLPETEAAARETLAVPVYPELAPAQREHVAETVVDFLRKG